MALTDYKHISVGDAVAYECDDYAFVGTVVHRDDHIIQVVSGSTYYNVETDDRRLCLVRARGEVTEV